MGKRKYSKEQIDFLRNHTGSYKERRKDFFERYGIELSESKFDHLAARYNFRHGHKCYPNQREQFKKMANKGWEVLRKPLGYIRKNKDGTTWIKYKNGDYRNNFTSLARYTWEQAYGKIDNKREVIIYLDGNYSNNSLDNLYKIRKSELRALSMRKLKFNNKELTLAGIAVNNVLMRANKVKSESKGKGRSKI